MTSRYLFLGGDGIIQSTIGFLYCFILLFFFLVTANEVTISPIF